MATQVAEEVEKARPLRELVPLIKDELEQAYGAGMDHYRRAGDLLLEAKAQLRAGEWAGWLTRNFTMSMPTARRYMALAAEYQKPESRRRTFTKLSDVLESHRPSHQPAWHKSVSDSVKPMDMKRLVQERETRENEARLVRELGMKLIDIGYKVLATQLHPDKGGSNEAMTRLGKVRGILRSAL
jgi:hypothetical protein